MMPLIGTAGWSIPKDVRDRFPPEGTLLARYAQRFSCVEINSSFYRPHRVSTYERWAASVPAHFRFSLKVPKTITHKQRLIDCTELLVRFIEETAALGEKRAVLLVQLPPSFAFNMATTAEFFATFRSHYAGLLACEPRHPSWFADEPQVLLRSLQVAQVAVDPAIVPEAGAPGGWQGFAYFRWHGSPRTYYSAYGATQLEEFATAVERVDAPSWCIFDNTTLGAATENALTLAHRMKPS